MIEHPLLALALVSSPDPSVAELSAISLLEPLPSATATAPAPLHDGSPWFFRVNGGLVTTEDFDAGGEEIDFDEGWLLAFAVGNRVTSGDKPVNFDIELETVWTDQDANDDGLIQAVEDVNVGALLLNGMVDWRFAERLSLYGGAGIGAAMLDVGTESGFDDEDGPFLAWQARAGFLWHFAETTGFQVGYRFLNVDDAEIDDGGLGNAEFDLETQQHAIEVGLCFGI